MVLFCEILKKTKYIRIYDPDFSNPQFYEPSENSNQKSDFHSSLTLPRFLELPEFSNPFLFPLEARKIGIPLYIKLVF